MVLNLDFILIALKFSYKIVKKSLSFSTKTCHVLEVKYLN